MEWRRRIGVVLLAIVSSGGFCATLHGEDDFQIELEAFSDAQLPNLPDHDDDALLAPAEELPPVQPDARSPKIDPDVVEPARTSASESPGGATLTQPSGGFSIDDDTFADDQEDAEFLPQETIRQRYPDGRVKIERGVAQDDQENYVNHGPWRMWDETGNLVAEGAYRFGKRHGKWVRWYQADGAELLSVPPFNLFTAPFLSQAHFRDGELDGRWVITDHADLKVCEWTFLAGRRHGESIWYYHTGRKMRVINYRAGEIHGELLEWDINGNPVTRVQYEEGQRHEKTQQTYPNGQKKIEGMVLQARLVMKQPDDWWEAKMATYVAKGKDQKHGEWKAWFPNGQQRFAGTYQLDKADGDFTWWHANGQKSLKAFYEQGMKQGQWTWWHPSGQKSIQGQYSDNSPTDRWVWWQETGKVSQRIDFSQAGAPIANGAEIISNPVMTRPFSP